MTDKLLIEALEETRDTLAKVLIKIRRDAPDLSGKLLGHADQVIARVDALLDAPANRSQQEAAQEPAGRCIRFTEPCECAPEAKAGCVTWRNPAPNAAVAVAPSPSVEVQVGASTAPSESAARKPLTDKQIEAGYHAAEWSGVPHPFRGSVGFERGVKFAERAHGITDAALSQGGGA